MMTETFEEKWPKVWPPDNYHGKGKVPLPRGLHGIREVAARPLVARGIVTIGQLLKMTRTELALVPGVGELRMAMVIDDLGRMGKHLKGDEAPVDLEFYGAARLMEECREACRRSTPSYCRRVELGW